jgi:predicted dehydrogenase
MSRVKFAFVGCGRIVRKHADSLKFHLNEKAELIAICDTIFERAKSAGEEYSVPFFKDYDSMLKSHPDVDVVTILSESGSHAKIAVDIVSKYKKHVVIEKPMALTLDDADKMIRCCDENGVKLFVVKQNRYNLAVIKLRKDLEAGKFGKIVMGTVRVRWCRRQKYYDQDSWRGTWAMDGGVFSNQASHHVDLLLWMLGEPISVFAKSRKALVDIETEDTGVAVITFRDGSIGIVEATTATRPKDIEGSLSLLGEYGFVEIGGFAVNELKHYCFENQTNEDDRELDQYRENPSDVYGYGHIKYLENVIDSLNNRTKALVDGLEGRKSLELIHAIYESIETGKEVIMRFQPDKCKLGR